MAKDETKNAPETTATAEAPIPEVFHVKATVELRGDGGPQAAFNIQVINPEAQAILDALGAKYGAQVKNKAGDYWVAVKAGAGARTKLRQAKAFSVVLEGSIRLNKLVNGQFRGELFDVMSATAATLSNGGRIIERERQERADIEQVAVGAAQMGGRGGMRSLLGNLR